MNRFLDIPYRYAEGGARISLYEIRREDQIFSYHSEQIWTHFHVGRLWRMITERPSLYEAMSVTLIEADMRTIVASRGIETEHLDRIGPDGPGILCTLPNGESIVVDGNHRYVKRWRLGLRKMDFWDLTEEQCKPSILDVPTDLMAYLVEEHRKRQNAVRR